MLKQPVGIKLLTNVSIVKLKLGKSRFEIACYPNKVQDYRDKIELDIDEVLQTKEIYSNAIKGEISSKKQLKDTFPNMTKSEIIKLILEKGDLQLGDKERKTEASNMKKYIVTIIVEKTYNTNNGLPFPPDLILKVLDLINFPVHDNENAKKQSLKAIKEIIDKKILPMARRLIQLKLTLKLPESFSDSKTEIFEKTKENTLSYLKEIEAEIIEQNLENPSNFEIKANIQPNFYREILNKFSKILNILILSQTEVSVAVKKNEKEEEEYNGADKDNGESDQGVEMKIANCKVDEYLEENFEEELRDNNEVNKKAEDDKEISNQINKKDNKKKKNIIKITCTKCKDSVFEDRDQLRQHFKTNWHKYNSVQSAQENGVSLSAEEYDEYVLMHPEELK